MSCLNVHFVSQSGEDGLRNYKYAGQDNGLFYRFFWDPVCKQTIKCVPDWIAPNMVTFIGLIWAFVPFAVMIALNYNNYDEPVQSWFCFLQAACFFTYRLADEMDGKHARATGNGSPLGLLFDHGCDCFALGMQMMLFFYIHGFSLIEQWNMCAFVMITSYAAFHFETLEEYYRGKLVLPPCNGATDGSSISIIWYFVLGFIGPDKMIIKFEVLGFQTCVADWCAYLITGSATIYTIINIINMIVSKYRPYDTQAEVVNFLSLSYQVAAFMSWAAMWYAVSLVKTSYPFEDENHAKYSVNNLLLAWYVCVMTHQTWLIQLSHVTACKFKPIVRSHILIVAFLSGAVVLVVSYFKSDMNIVLFLVISFGLTFILQWHYIFCVINQVATILGIKVFITKQTMERRRIRKQSKQELGADLEQQSKQPKKPYFWFSGKQVAPHKSAITMCTTPSAASESANIC